MTSETHIAVIGMAGRFPGAADLEQFWANLAGGVESLRRLTDDELRRAGEDPARRNDPGYIPVQGVLDEATGFDAKLFGYSPREAMLIDPQQRVFLECAWHALEDAGYDPQGYPGDIGVYGGCSPSTYAYQVWLDGKETVSSLDEYQVTIATAPDHLTSRVSYKLGLTGPSVAVMTTCSTSLVAIHQAAQSLLGGECGIALAGGASVGVPARGYLYREGGTLSPDGHVRTFDAAAAGMVGADGVGVVVLKRLDEALADGDRVRAVLISSAVGNLGAERAGYTAPSVVGQTRLIRSALRLAEVEPDTISYIEAHGTGTRVGDPIELAALTRAFRASTDKVGFCAVGSVKTNIGHTDAAAGVASFIKTVLALEHRQIPPSLHFTTGNPEIDFDNSPFFVNTELREWQGEGGPLRAGVSSFGLGGTNAHAILQEAPPRPTAPVARSARLLTLSAATGSALDAMTANLAEHLSAPGVDLDSVAYTLQTGRQSLTLRRYAVCTDPADAVAVLTGAVDGRLATATRPASKRPLVFLFPGQGAQHLGMARSLYDQVAPFRSAVDECAELLVEHLGLDLRQLLRRSDDAAAEQLTRTAIAQPALFTIEYALARTLIGAGVVPSAMLGHSVGELVAACLAGVFTLPDALHLVARRGRLMQDQPGGAMLAVSLAEPDLARLLPAGLAVAAVNGADRCVVSGPHDAVDAFAALLATLAVPTTRLRTSHAFHSALMDPAGGEFAAAVGRTPRQPPSARYMSNVTGDWITAEQAVDPGYWADHLRSTVRFGDGLTTAAGLGAPILLEVGPGQSLTGLARRQLGADCTAVATLPRAGRADDDLATFLAALGQVWASGCAVDWAALHDDRTPVRVPVPLYPFERVEHVLPIYAAAAPVRPAAAAAAAVEPVRPTGRDEPAGTVQERVSRLFGAVLGMETVAGDADFFELGGDSLTATQLISRTRDAFSVAVPLDSVFDHPTPGEFAEALAELLVRTDAVTGGDKEGRAS
ncbi:acyl transferase domain-containing protein [Allocatelliglobosispora scoriae]|uniref:Acyl transferase domain-containing protein n=1 Tax=Allocatelliglobosispora scoriae TaxID=643052 RepID=A0A841C689_9ACTN|nr:type I polyketide synthase [Allocatelliglobosispora scoriae]MBB5874663.1 acyl transferase domain-containing protein [Allocatelliglobosispora scoriae]